MILLTTGIIFLLGGLLMFKFPPESINGVIGYRTPMSMKNKDTWDEAKKYSMIKL